MARKIEKGWSGVYMDQVRSALQKSIRRGDLDGAAFWATEMYLSGEVYWLWSTLLTITSEDVGPAWLEGPAVIRALYESWRFSSQDLAWMHAVVLLVRAPKSRLVDDMLAAHVMSHDREFARPVPEFALDSHTVRGRMKGRTDDSEEGQRFWWEEAGRIEDEGSDPHADRYKELVKQWWAEGRPYAEPRKSDPDAEPLAGQRTPYQLPLGVERDGDVVRVPGSRQGDVWVVDLAKRTCTCPAFARFPGLCKHLKALLGSAASTR